MRIMLPLSRRASLSLIAAGVTVAAVVVIAPGSASAAVSYVLLGRSNYAATQTNISNRGGTPLGLNAKSGYAPLWVNSTKQVNRLNADYVNGYHASSFARMSGKTGIIVAYNGPATCPQGTILTGGGGLSQNAANELTALAYSGPYIDAVGGLVPNSWLAVPVNYKGGDPFYSFAVCYNPAGPVPGAVNAPALSKIPSFSR